MSVTNVVESVIQLSNSLNYQQQQNNKDKNKDYKA